MLIAIVLERLNSTYADGSRQNANTSTADGNRADTIRTIPKPRGSDGGGRRGFHLQEEMRLADDEEGQRRYNMILVSTVNCSHSCPELTTP